MGLTRKLAVGLGTIAILLVLNQIFEHGVGDFFVNPYYARIVNIIGINITLAVSLNLINGLAGQFSIGHSGFMAVGGYTATYVTVYHGDAMARVLGDDARRARLGAGALSWAGELTWSNTATQLMRVVAGEVARRRAHR